MTNDEMNEQHDLGARALNLLAVDVAADAHKAAVAQEQEARRELYAACAAAVDLGELKTVVAKAAGISRPTLDAVIRDFGVTK